MANLIVNHVLPDVPIKLTNTGFHFGALVVDRVCTLPRGVACVRLETPLIALNIRVTKTGRVRIYMDNGMEVLTLARTTARPAGSESAGRSEGGV